MKVRSTFWVFVLILSACIGGAILTRDQIYYRLIYLVCIIIVISFLWSFFSIKGITVKRSARSSRQQVGEVFDETIEVANSFILVRLWLEVRDQAPLPGSSGTRILSWIGAKSVRSYAVYTMLIRRGEFKLGPTIISSGDPLGLFSFQRKIPGDKKSLLVLPYLVDLKSFPFPAGLLPGGRAIRRRALEITPHAAGVREYVHGDSLNRIHWPSTARKDRLMVKEFDQDPQADIFVFLDSCSNGHVRAKEAEEFIKVHRNWLWWTKREAFKLYPSTYEYAVSSAASIVKYFLRNGQSVGFVSVGQISTVLTAEKGDRQLEKILETLAFLRCEGELPLHGLVKAQVGYLPRGSTVIVITPSVREDVVLAIDELLLRDMRPVVVLIDPHSFDSPFRIENVIDKISTRGIPLTTVRKDDDLREALEVGFKL
jgi:uncharacterized protein (DUF58 family)